MFLELIATFAAGIAAAGCALLAGRLSGGRLPRWATPVAAGLAMIAYSIWSEYSWADRTIAALPEGVAVVQTIEERFPWKPWTYLAPQTARLIALDHAGALVRPDTPNIKLTDLYFFGRWQPTAKRAQLIDCAAPARADVTDAALADPTAADWVALGAEDPLIATACAP
jgi:hypothetical protein